MSREVSETVRDELSAALETANTAPSWPDRAEALHVMAELLDAGAGTPMGVDLDQATVDWAEADGMGELVAAVRCVMHNGDGSHPFFRSLQP